MITRELMTADMSAYEKLSGHPLQSWAWGDFREKTGVEVVRAGTFDGSNLISAYQMTFHHLPYLPYTVGYFPKGGLPDREMITQIKKIGRANNAIFVKIEPHVPKTDKFLPQGLGLIPAYRPVFTRYTFIIDLTPAETELFNNFHPKTRYNIRLAQNKGVTIQEENSPEAFTRHLELTRETAVRQGFYAHNDNYHRRMWETLAPRGIAHLLTARYQGLILATWIVFLYKESLYYPYGASTQEYKEVMASNLMMWEAIRWGKNHGARLFDLWGSPGPDPKPGDPYYGFHRFKMGYNPKLVEFVGSYDLVLQPPLYRTFRLADKLRWGILKLTAQIPI